MKNVAYIYALCDPVSCEIRYVGKTNNLVHRLWHHIKGDNSRSLHKDRWIAKLIQSGSRPELEILEVIEYLNDIEWQISECFWISYLRFLGCRLTNLDGGGNSGKLRSKETIQRLSEAHKGKQWSAKQWDAHFARDRRHTPEQIQKQIKAQTGRVFSDETRAKISKANQGKVVSNQVRKKISNTLTGRKQGDELILRRTEAMRAAIKEGRKPGNAVGYKRNESVKRKISETLKYQAEERRLLKYG